MSLLLSTGAFASSLSGAAPGMVLVSPTSITHSGTSATLGANGQVTFSAVTSLSLNGVFSADFDNYVIAVRGIQSTGDDHTMRLRASGSDNSTASSYVVQYLLAASTTVAAGRETGNNARVGAFGTAHRNGYVLQVYGPYIAQPTAFRSVVASSIGDAYIQESAGTHNQSTSYDGFTIVPQKSLSGNMTGELAVYGIRS